jgi:acylphosphatase
VQGVGFRATAVSIAHNHAVTGWVRNLPEGRVQLLVEGTETEVQRFLQEVRDRMQGYIEQEQIEERPATGKFTAFQVVR